MQKVRLSVVALASALAVLLGTAPFGYAAVSTQSAGAGNGYKISPVRTDLTLGKGTGKNVTVNIQNVTSQPVELQVVINDFTTDNENGSPALLIDNKNAPVHGLKQYVVTPKETITLQPNEQKAVSVRINIPLTARAGGYFGAVRFAPAGLNGERTVNLAASVASLILVTVPGDYKEQMSLASFTITQEGHQRSIFTSPKNLKAEARFKNSGDVHEQPFGKVTVKKGNKTLYTVEINNTDPKGNVLPDSVRRFNVDLKNVSSFGKYKVEGNFGYGNKGQLLSASTTFYVIPLGLIVVALGVLVLLVFLVFVLPRIVRGHDQRVLRRAGRR